MAVPSVNECSSINSVLMLWLMLHVNINLIVFFKSVVSANFSIIETLINYKLAILQKHSHNLTINLAHKYMIFVLRIVTPKFMYLHWLGRYILVFVMIDSPSWLLDRWDGFTVMMAFDYRNRFNDVGTSLSEWWVYLMGLTVTMTRLSRCLL